MFFGVFGFPCPVESVLWGYSKQDWVVCFIVQLILKLTRKLFCLPPASETPHYGSYQAHYIWAGASGPLLPRGPVTNHRVSFFTQVLFQQDTCSCFIWSFCCKYPTGLKCFCVFLLSVFAGCQIPYPKREFLNEDEPEEKTEKVIAHGSIVYFRSTSSKQIYLLWIMNSSKCSLFFGDISFWCPLVFVMHVLHTTTSTSLQIISV